MDFICNDSFFTFTIHAEICDACSKNVWFCKKIIIPVFPKFVHCQILPGPAIYSYDIILCAV